MTEEFVANIFGMPPRNVTRLPQDERQAINTIMGGLGFPSIYKPTDPEDAAPSAIAILRTLGLEYGVGPQTAARWLTERADEIKTLYESNK
jgi:hypothetical protein